jgi:hypothetical protein
VTGSTSAQNVKDTIAPKANLQEYSGYSECIAGLQSGAVDAVTTDDSILAGFAAQDKFKGQFKLAGLKLSNENYGIGVKKGDSATVTKINTALEKMVSRRRLEDRGRPRTSARPTTRTSPPRRSATSSSKQAIGPTGAPPNGGRRAEAPYPEAREIVFDFLEGYDVLGAFWMTVKLTVSPPSAPWSGAPCWPPCGSARSH